MTIPQALQLAMQRHQAGRLADAETLCRQVLAVNPGHAGALRLLGVIAHQVGRQDLAMGWIRQAIVIDPNNAIAHCILGEACHAMGHIDEAMASFHRALELQPNYPEAYNDLGNALAQGGRLDEAVAAYRHAIEIKPGYPEAHNNLGNALKQQGHLHEAVAAYRRALQLEPELPQTHYNLGNSLAAEGRLDEAVAAFRRALELKPEFPDAHNNLGNALRAQGRFDESVAACRRALELQPDHPEAHNNLGAALDAQGQSDEAIAAYRQAIRVNPDFPQAHFNLGNSLRKRGQLDEAIAAYVRAIGVKPRYLEAHTNLAEALRERGQLDQAVAACRRAIELEPSFPEALANLGNALLAQRKLDEAVAAFHRAIELQPDYPEAHNNLGVALWSQRRFDEAVAACRYSLDLRSDNPQAYSNLALAHMSRGELDEAITAYRRALEIDPGNAEIHSNLIYTLHFHPDQDSNSIFEEQRRWNRQFGDPLKPLAHDGRTGNHGKHGSRGAIDRPLRIGYVSADFRDHAVGRFLLPLFQHHDRARFEIICYSGVTLSDSMTQRFHKLASAWRNTVGVPDARLAEMIREDEIDILVDLAMHAADNRLTVFARQPAPVQITWLAYPGSTGLPSIGYRLTDARMDPPGEKPAWSAEEPVRLPDCWCCFQPAGPYPEITALPASSGKGVTFGALNSFAKVNEGVLGLWARVLREVRGSRLLMMCPEGSARGRVRAFFGARGMGAERVEFVSYLPRWDYFRLYQQIDVALDPFPFNGMTTTCDALWMGAPVLTLPGEMPASRASLSILSTVEFGELASSEEEDYVRIAAELAGDLPRLAELRATLRERMQASPLMDAPRFASNVEAAYCSIWKRWRKENKG